MISPEHARRTPDQIEDWFKHHIAELTGARADTIAGDADFDSFGIDSLQAVDMMTALETWLGMPDDLPMEVLFEAPSIADAARRVAAAQDLRITQA